MHRTDQQVLDLLNQHVMLTRTWDTFMGWFVGLRVQTIAERSGSCTLNLSFAAGKVYTVHDATFTAAMITAILKAYPDEHECINDWLNTLERAGAGEMYEI